MSWLRRKYNTLKRIFYWGWKLRHNYDYDCHSIYEILYLKLDRVYYEMLHHGHSLWNSSPDTKDMRRLCEAKNLAKKLSENYRYGRHYEKASSKYRRERLYALDEILGELYPDAKFINDKLYSVMFRKAFEKDEAEQKRDSDRLFYLVGKYMRGWWD